MKFSTLGAVFLAASAVAAAASEVRRQPQVTLLPGNCGKRTEELVAGFKAAKAILESANASSQASFLVCGEECAMKKDNAADVLVMSENGTRKSSFDFSRTASRSNSATWILRKLSPLHVSEPGTLASRSNGPVVAVPTAEDAAEFEHLLQDAKDGLSASYLSRAIILISPILDGDSDEAAKLPVRLYGENGDLLVQTATPKSLVRHAKVPPPLFQMDLLILWTALTSKTPVLLFVGSGESDTARKKSERQARNALQLVQAAEDRGVPIGYLSHDSFSDIAWGMFSITELPDAVVVSIKGWHRLRLWRNGSLVDAETARQALGDALDKARHRGPDLRTQSLPQVEVESLKGSSASPAVADTISFQLRSTRSKLRVVAVLAPFRVDNKRADRALEQFLKARSDSHGFVINGLSNDVSRVLGVTIKQVPALLVYLPGSDDPTPYPGAFTSEGLSAFVRALEA